MHILVVDDDQAVRDSLARSLQYSNGYEVTTAEDGLDALAKLSSLRPDAVVMDVMMPRLDGLETTRMLRSSGNDVPILILTARDAVDDRVDPAAELGLGVQPTCDDAVEEVGERGGDEERRRAHRGPRRILRIGVDDRRDEQGADDGQRVRDVP